MSFTIYPAIDLRNGRVVRMEQGNPDNLMTFSDDPLSIARHWVELGAKWLHIVNLDGAFDEKTTENWKLLPQLANLGAKVQFGGGVRTLGAMDWVLAQKVDRVVLGTLAIENPDLVATAVQQFGADCLAVGLDARNGRLQTRGWLKDTNMTPLQAAKNMAGIGIRHIVYTDIERDGLLSGVDAATTAQIAQTSGLAVIASGGVGSLADVQKAAALADQGVSGLIIGRALYENKFTLPEALQSANAG